MTKRKQISARIQAALDEKRWTAGDLSRKLDVPRQTAYGWVRKENPSVPDEDMFPRVASALGKPLAWLRDGIEPPRAQDIDYDMLFMILRVIEEETSAMGLGLNDEQRARIATAAYRSSSTLQTVDRSLIKDMVAIALVGR